MPENNREGVRRERGRELEGKGVKRESEKVRTIAAQVRLKLGKGAHVRLVCTCRRALSSVSKVSPSLLMSSWKVVIPVSLPATVKEKREKIRQKERKREREREREREKGIGNRRS